MADFSTLPLPFNLLVLAAPARAVRYAGTKLTHHPDAVSNATAGRATINIIVLGGCAPAGRNPLAGRRDCSIPRMGCVSVLVLTAAAGGVVLLYTRRQDR